MIALVHLFIPLLIALLCARPLGEYMACIYTGKQLWSHKILGWLETGFYKMARIDPRYEMTWLEYFTTLLVIGAAGFVILFLILSGQGYLPLNPNHFSGLSPDLAFNTAISFVSHTSWQSYAGEAQLSYFSQSAGLVAQNFLSPAAGMSVAVALFRGLKRRNIDTLGNAWADMVRTVIYILLPLAFVFAIFLVSQGVIQNLSNYVAYAPLQPATDNPAHFIAQGPAASQLAIKVLGSNGGGFFNANSAHPYTNPTPLVNMACYTAILFIPVAFMYCFGVMVGDRRQGWALLAAMTLIYVPLSFMVVHNEQAGNPMLDRLQINQSAGNMEGKEVRIGTVDSALWATAATANSGGSVNSMYDSFMPLSGMIPLMLIQFGEVIYGGVGSGAIEMILYVLITVFLGGLMVGRTPEYLGKKIGPNEMKLVILAMIIPTLLVLGGTGLAVSIHLGQIAVHNQGAQGFTEILYAFSSVSRNNGSAFAGLHTDSTFYNIALGVCMLVARYWIFAPVLAVAGLLASKQASSENPGTLPTHTPLFAFMLIGVIILLDVLTYAPSLALGPIAEQATLDAFIGVPPP